MFLEKIRLVLAVVAALAMGPLSQAAEQTGGNKQTVKAELGPAWKEKAFGKGPGAIRSMILSPNGQRLLVWKVIKNNKQIGIWGERDATAIPILWDTRTGNEIGPLSGLQIPHFKDHVPLIPTLFSSDGKTIIAIDRDKKRPDSNGTLILWEAATLKKRAEWAVDHVPDGVWLSSDGKELVTIDLQSKRAQVCVLEGRQIKNVQLDTKHLPAGSLTLTGRNHYLAVGLWDLSRRVIDDTTGDYSLDFRIFLWDLKKGGQPVASLDVKEKFSKRDQFRAPVMEFSPNGKELLIAGQKFVAFDLATRKKVEKKLPVSPRALCWDGHKAQVAGLDKAGMAILWDVESQKEVLRLDTHRSLGEHERAQKLWSSRHFFATSNDGKTIAVGWTDEKSLGKRGNPAMPDWEYMDGILKVWRK